MTVITTRIRVAPDQSISGTAPFDLPPGEHLVHIRVDSEAFAAAVKASSDIVPVLDLGPWPARIGLRREDMYGDAER